MWMYLWYTGEVITRLHEVTKTKKRNLNTVSPSTSSHTSHPTFPHLPAIYYKRCIERVIGLGVVDEGFQHLGSTCSVGQTAC
jgi:hypothetical protein